MHRLSHLFEKQVAGGSNAFPKSLRNNPFPHTAAFPSPEAKAVVQFAGGLGSLDALPVEPVEAETPPFFKVALGLRASILPRHA